MGSLAISTQGLDDPRSSRTSRRPRPTPTRSASATAGRIGELDAAEIAAAAVEHERIESAVTRVAYFAHLSFATNMADTARGALVAQAAGARGDARDPAPLLRARVGRARGRARRRAVLADPALDHWRHHLASLRKFRPYLLSEPEERIFTEKAVSGIVVVVAPLRGAAERAAGRAGRRARSALETAMARLYASDRETRRGGCRGVTAALEPGSAHAHVHLQHDPARQVDRRPAAQLPDLALGAQPRERDHRRGRPGARRCARLALRRRRSATTA